MVELVKQRGEGDCVLASLSMYLEIDYDFLLEKYFDKTIPYGVSDSKTIDVLKDNNIKPVLIPGHYYPIAKAIVSVPSINFPGFLHSMFWDGDKFYDPSNKEIYKKLPFVVDSIVDLNDSSALKLLNSVIEHLESYK